MIDDDVIESTLLSVEALGGDEVMIGDPEVSAVTATVLLPSCCVGQRRLRAVTAELPAARPGLSRRVLFVRGGGGVFVLGDRGFGGTTPSGPPHFFPKTRGAVTDGRRRARHLES